MVADETQSNELLEILADFTEIRSKFEDGTQMAILLDALSEKARLGLDDDPNADFYKSLDEALESIHLDIRASDEKNELKEPKGTYAALIFITEVINGARIDYIDLADNRIEFVEMDKHIYIRDESALDRCQSSLMLSMRLLLNSIVYSEQDIEGIVPFFYNDSGLKTPTKLVSIGNDRFARISLFNAGDKTVALIPTSEVLEQIELSQASAEELIRSAQKQIDAMEALRKKLKPTD